MNWILYFLLSSLSLLSYLRLTLSASCDYKLQVLVLFDNTSSMTKPYDLYRKKLLQNFERLLKANHNLELAFGTFNDRPNKHKMNHQNYCSKIEIGWTRSMKIIENYLKNITTDNGGPPTPEDGLGALVSAANYAHWDKNTTRTGRMVVLVTDTAYRTQDSEFDIAPKKPRIAFDPLKPYRCNEHKFPTEEQTARVLERQKINPAIILLSDDGFKEWGINFHKQMQRTQVLAVESDWNFADAVHKSIEKQLCTDPIKLLESKNKIVPFRKKVPHTTQKPKAALPKPSTQKPTAKPKRKPVTPVKRLTKHTQSQSINKAKTTVPPGTSTKKPVISQILPQTKDNDAQNIAKNGQKKLVGKNPVSTTNPVKASPQVVNLLTRENLTKTEKEDETAKKKQVVTTAKTKNLIKGKAHWPYFKTLKNSFITAEKLGSFLVKLDKKRAEKNLPKYIGESHETFQKTFHDAVTDAVSTVSHIADGVKNTTLKANNTQAAATTPEQQLKGEDQSEDNCEDEGEDECEETDEEVAEVAAVPNNITRQTVKWPTYATLKDSFKTAEKFANLAAKFDRERANKKNSESTGELYDIPQKTVHDSITDVIADVSKLAKNVETPVPQIDNSAAKTPALPDQDELKNHNQAEVTVNDKNEVVVEPKSLPSTKEHWPIYSTFKNSVKVADRLANFVSKLNKNKKNEKPTKQEGANPESEVSNETLQKKPDNTTKATPALKDRHSKIIIPLVKNGSVEKESIPEIDAESVIDEAKDSDKTDSIGTSASDELVDDSKGENNKKKEVSESEDPRIGVASVVTFSKEPSAQDVSKTGNVSLDTSTTPQMPNTLTSQFEDQTTKDEIPSNENPSNEPDQKKKPVSVVVKSAAIGGGLAAAGAAASLLKYLLKNKSAESAVQNLSPVDSFDGGKSVDKEQQAWINFDEFA